MKYKHLFFDMDGTVAPFRQLMLSDMKVLLSSLEQDVIIVSGSSLEQMPNQISDLPCYRLGQNGNDATEVDGEKLWYTRLTDTERAEIMTHIDKLVATLDHDLNQEWHPIEDRGAQITFSPVGNTAPVEKKAVYDPDRSKRLKMIDDVPFESEDLVVKIGGSTSLDYIHKDRHKGTNVQKLIDLKGWNKDECVYFGDGLYPGGNDEAVIGVIETIPVTDHLDTYEKLKAMLKE